MQTIADTILTREELIDTAQEMELQYQTDVVPGFTRQRSGKGFFYKDQAGKKVVKPIELTRIQKLSIPPAWRDVWISPNACGHLQATGIDEKGRKQYLYHTKWNSLCQQNKFNKVIFFGSTLPEIRKTVAALMKEPGLSKKKVLATIVWLLEHTYIRIGNIAYAKENNSFGLTTLREKHVAIHGNTIKFSFKGKSGVYHEVDVMDRKVARIIRKLEELPGYELFQYLTDDGNRQLVDSRDVNDFLKELTGEQISAKDFRTWGGTTYAADHLYKLGPATDKTAVKKNITQAIKYVAKHLRNTPATCRSYYIHPSILQTYTEERLHSFLDEKTKEYASHSQAHFSSHEYAVVELLREEQRMTISN